MKPKTLLPRMLAIMVTMLLSWNSLFADEYEYFKIGDTKILSWEKVIDNISDQKALKYRICQRIVDDSGDIDWKLLKNVSDVDSYTVKDLSEGEEYVFDVEAMDEKGNRASYTDDSGLRVTTPDVSAPHLGDISGEGGDGFVELCWPAATDNVTSPEKMKYKINKWTIIDVIDVSAPHLGDISGEGGDGFVELCWPAATDNVTSPEKMKYRIYKWSMIRIGKRGHLIWSWKLVQQLQGKAGSNCFTIPSLKNNDKYSFKVVAIDEAGNSSEGKEITVFTKDTEAPKPLELTIGKITEHSVELRWTPTTDNRTESQNLQYLVYCRIPGEPWSKLATFTGSETTSYTIKGLMPETKYEISLDVWDAAGNRRETIRTITTLQDVEPPIAVLDVEPPITGKLSLKEFTANSVTLQWEPATDKVTASDKLKYTVLYKAESDSEWSKAIENATNTTTYTVEGLKPNTKYLFEVKVVDGSNNASFYNKDSGGLLVTTEEEPDVVFPVPGVLSIGEVTHNSVTLNWTKATDNKTKQEELTYTVYGKIGEGKWEPLTTLTDATNYVVKGLQPKTVYRFDVVVKDKAENSEAYVPGGLEVTTLATPDDEAPTTGVIGTSNVTYNSITLNWEAASDNMTSIDKLRYTLLYKEKGASKWIEKELGVNVTTYRLEGLKEKTTYWLTVKVCDEEKNCAYYNKDSDGLLVTTKEEPDVENPDPGVLSIGEVTHNSVTLNWTKATDNKTKQEELTYMVYCRMGEGEWERLTTLTDATNYVVKDLQPKTVYRFDVVVEDKAENSEEYVPEGLEVTTLATPDNEAPTTGVIGTSNVTYNSITLNWVAASDNMTSIDKLRYTLLYKEKGASEWIEKELGVNVTTYRLEGLKEKTTYWLTVKVCDEEKNCAYYNKLDDPLSVDVPEAPDTQVPHAGVLNVDKVSDSSILVRWTKATDDKTPAEALVYRVAWKAKEETEWHYSVEGEEPWQENLDSYLIEELKADTEYAIELMVMDKAKNKATYGQLTTRTAKPSGIEGVEQEVQEDSAIYDLSGRRQQQLKSGINIVRTKQGKVKRILVK